MAKIGYARCSTKDQSVDLQIKALAAAGCSIVFEEYESGVKTDRPQLREALDALSEGDILVVYKLDRLSRSLKDLIEIAKQIEAKGAVLNCTSQQISTEGSMGRLFFYILGAIAEMERELIIERTTAGLEVARKLGRRGGRPRTIKAATIELAKEQIAAGKLKKDVANQLNISRASLYRLLDVA
jgi:DNA invertase Pin-like site-specific DNA recombinase